MMESSEIPVNIVCSLAWLCGIVSDPDVVQQLPQMLKKHSGAEKFLQRLKDVFAGVIIYYAKNMEMISSLYRELQMPN